MLNYYNSIDNLPIARFVKISETGSLDWLKHYEDDNVDSAVLELVYAKILTEYRDATVNLGNNSLILGIQKQILALQLKHDIIKMACFNLEFCYNEESIKILEKYGYKISSDRSIAEQLHEIAYKASNLKTKWMHKQTEINDIANRQSGSDMTFDQYVWKISDRKGYQLDTEQISVRKWIAMEINLINESKEQQNGGNKKK